MLLFENKILLYLNDFFPANFLAFVAKPLYEVLLKFLPSTHMCIDHMHSNGLRLKNLVASESEHSGPTGAATTAKADGSGSGSPADSRRSSEKRLSNSPGGAAAAVNQESLLKQDIVMTTASSATVSGSSIVIPTAPHTNAVLDSSNAMRSSRGSGGLSPLPSVLASPQPLSPMSSSSEAAAVVLDAPAPRGRKQLRPLKIACVPSDDLVGHAHHDDAS